MPDPLPPSDATVIIFAGRGTGRNVSTDPTRTRFEVPLFDVSTGEQIGRSTHNFSCNGALTCEDTDTYHLPQGTVVKTSDVSIAPHTQRPGTVTTATHPVAHQLGGTGEFADRTGMIRLHGFADISQFPRAITLDEIYILSY